MEQVLVEPPLYFADDHVFDIEFHPGADVLASCLVTGEVSLLSYSSEDVVPRLSLHYHSDSVRKVQFSPDGQCLASASKDRSLGFVDAQGKLIHQIKMAHEQGLNSIQFIDNQLLASADEEGEIKIWDLRTGKSVWQCHEQEESITQMGIGQEQTMLLATSYDGTLGVYDLRKAPSSEERLYALSDCLEEDLLAMQVMKQGRFVVTASNQGTLFIFKWDYFGDCSDLMRLSGQQSSSIDSLVKIDEDTLLAGGEDGYLRAISIYPNRVHSILGKHSEDEEHFPIFKIARSRCGNFVASTSNDSSIKFYEITELLRERAGYQPGEEDYTPDEVLMQQRRDRKQQDREELEEEDQEESDSEEAQPKQKKVTAHNYEMQNNTFFDGL